MAKGFKFGGGGSPSAGLNFKIAGGETAPQNPSENTIWIKTAQTITGWVISPEEPETLSEGLVWIQTGESEICFNALKKNELRVCLIGASVVTGGALAPAAGALWDGAAWLDFSTEAVYLYLPGDVCEDLTGGYVATGLRTGEATTSSGTGAPSVTYSDDSMVVSGSKASSLGSYVGGIVRTASKIDCNGYSKLIFEGAAEGTGYQYSSATICLWTEMGSYQGANLAASVKLSDGSDPVELDISDLNDCYYIGIGFSCTNANVTVTMNSLRLE